MQPHVHTLAVHHTSCVCGQLKLVRNTDEINTVNVSYSAPYTVASICLAVPLALPEMLICLVQIQVVPHSPTISNDHII